MWKTINDLLVQIDNLVWGVPLMVLIMAGGILLTLRLGLLQIRKLPLALKWMVKNEEGGEGEISSFSALCTALSATIGTGNIVGVATAVGYTVSIVLLAGIRERIEGNDIPYNFQGSPIVLVTAGLMAIAFFGFSGLL